MTGNLFLGGLPTGPDVRKLEQAFGDPLMLRGTTQEHERFEGILGIARDSARYKTVINAYRRKVAREFGVEVRGDLREVVGVGYRFLTDSEQLSFHHDLKKRAGRNINHSYRALASTDTNKLTTEQQREREHGLGAVRAIHAALIESRKFKPQLPETKQV